MQPALLCVAVLVAELCLAGGVNAAGAAANSAVAPHMLAAHPHVRAPRAAAGTRQLSSAALRSKKAKEAKEAAERRRKWKEVAESWRALPKFSSPVATQPVLVDPTLPAEDVERHFNSAEMVPPPPYVVPLKGEKYISTSVPNFDTKGSSVRIACALSATSKGMTISSIDELPLLRSFLPTFAYLLQEQGSFIITPYVAFDTVDPLLGNQVGRDHVAKRWKEKLPNSPDITWVQCEYTGKPAWNQNDAAMAAYEAGEDFIFRVNDDTKLAKTSEPVLQRLFESLMSLHPPALGISGPFCGMGNLDILTHEFTHRSHVDRFGFYYPRQFSTWYADEWISNIYAPMHTRINFKAKVEHTSQTRYDVDAESKKLLASSERDARRKLRAWQPHVFLTTAAGASQFVTPLVAKIWHDFGWNPHTLVTGAVADTSSRVLKELGLPLCAFAAAHAPSGLQDQPGFCWPGRSSAEPPVSHPYGRLGSAGLWVHEHGEDPLVGTAPDLPPVTLSGPGVPLLMRMLLPGTLDLDDDQYVVSLDGHLLPTSDHYWPFMPGFQRVNFSTVAYVHRQTPKSSPSGWLGVAGYMRAWRDAFYVKRGQHPSNALAALLQQFVAHNPSSRWASAVDQGALVKNAWSIADASALVDEVWVARVPVRLPDQYGMKKTRHTRLRPARSLAESSDTHGLSVMVVTINTRARPGMFALSQSGFTRSQQSLILHRSKYVGVQVPEDIVNHWDLFRKLLGKVNDFELSRSAIEKYRVAFIHELSEAENAM